MSKPLTISIVTYNSAPLIASCLQSLQHQTFSAFDIIVVDNHSTDETIQEVHRVAPQARVIALENNVGFGAAHNIAIHASDSEYILVLNPDCTLKETALRRLMNAAEVQEEAAAISPCILRSPNDSVIDSTGLVKTFYGAAYDRGAGKPLPGSLKQSGSIWGVSGACALYRRSALEEVQHTTDSHRPQYFDEDFFMYKEDVDLAARLQRAGWSAWYQHDAIAYHTRTGKPSKIQDTKRNRETRKEYINKHSYRNHLLYLVKNVRGLAILPSFFYEFMKFVYLFVFETKTLSVWPSVIKAIPTTLSKRYE